MYVAWVCECELSVTLKHWATVAARIGWPALRGLTENLRRKDTGILRASFQRDCLPRAQSRAREAAFASGLMVGSLAPPVQPGSVRCSLFIAHLIWRDVAELTKDKFGPIALAAGSR